MFKVFDGVGRLKRAIELVDKGALGVAVVLPRLSDSDPILRKYAVYKARAGRETAIAFGLTIREARNFAAVAKWRAAQHDIDGAGDADIETTFRVGEER